MNIDQAIIQSIQNPMGKIILTLIALGIGLLLLTFLPEIIGVVIVGVVIYLGLHYFSTKVNP
jgi:membrane-bound ClpP family serine protease